MATSAQTPFDDLEPQAVLRVTENADLAGADLPSPARPSDGMTT